MHLYSSDLTRLLAAKHRRSQAHYRLALTEITDAITKLLSRGHHLTIIGFGTFETRVRPTRKVIDIRTKKPITQAAHNRIAFRAGEGLKSAARKQKPPMEKSRKGKKK